MFKELTLLRYLEGSFKDLHWQTSTSVWEVVTEVSIDIFYSTFIYYVIFHLHVSYLQ